MYEPYIFPASYCLDCKFFEQCEYDEEGNGFCLAQDNCFVKENDYDECLLFEPKEE